MRDMRFSPDVVEVPAGDRLVVELVNADDQVHDLVLENGAGSGRLPAGERTRLDVGVVQADLDGWCSVAGHRLMGMTLRVVATGPGAAPPAGEEGHDPSLHDPSLHDPSLHDPAAAASAAQDVDLMAEPSGGWTAPDAVLPRAATSGTDARGTTTEPDPDGTGRLHRVTLRVTETVAEVAPGVRQTRWTFGGTAPGPVLRGQVGDTFVVTLENDGSIGHSVDFHAGALAPDGPMRTIGPGERLTYTFRADRSGIWMYHCSTMPMSLHIANGMFGAVVVDPPDLAPVDHELLLVQSELYLGAQGADADPARLATQQPDLVVFNGYANAYRYAPLRVRTGERVRVWVLDAGPNRPSSFHVVGGQFDTVYSEGAYLLRDGGPTGTGGAQALALQPAQGGFVELELPEAGHYSAVTHVMGDAEKGAQATIEVTDR
jgi:nitrite reductase (NO-forming)